MSTSVKAAAGGTSKAIGGLREVIQDLVAPDLRALKTAVEALGQEIRLRTEALSTEMKLRFESLQDEMRLRDEHQSRRLQALAEGMQVIADGQNQQIQSLTGDVKDLSRRLDFTIELRERVAVLESRLPRT